MRAGWRWGTGGALAVAVLAAGFAALAWRPALPAEPRPDPAGFPAATVQHGQTLAALGNCAACHSAPGGKPYSGGVPIRTPFGTVYGSNLTPDPETGLGHWSEAAFRRAMREGVGRNGEHLYPAFPYDHFTHVDDADVGALYAYMMTRAPVRQDTPAPDLVWPLRFRPLLAGWKLLFFRQGDGAPPSGPDPVLARGANLVDGLGHCGACHTPRNLLGAEKKGEALAGGLAEGWNAYALNAASPAPIPWTREAMAFYLGHGWQAVHGVSRGPMASVTANLGTVPAADLDAMAAYLVAGMGEPDAQKAARSGRLEEAAAGALVVPAASGGTQVAVANPPAAAGTGEAVYAGACQSCHSGSRPVPFGGLPLALSSALHAPDPTNIITVTLHGLRAPAGDSGPIMPGFEGTITDEQMVALLGYLRGPLAHEPPWPDLPATVKRARTQAVTLSPGDGTSQAPADTAIREAP